MKEPEYYLTCGYEDHGYISPELSSSDIYPEYIKQEVCESVKSIQSHQGYDTVTFAFMTDLHYALSYNHEIRMKRTVNAYKEVAKRVHIDRLILGGDYTNEGCKEYKADCYRELRALFDGIDYFPVHGNHDDGTIWDQSYLKNEKCINHFDHEELYKLFYNHLPSKGAKMHEHSLYYMIDDKNTKTRYICLDSGDIPYIFDDKGSLLYRGQHLFVMRNEQLNWLADKALRFDEEGWSVVFFIHSLALPSIKTEDLGDIRNRMPVLNSLIGAYKKGKAFKADSDEKDLGYHVEVDFSNYVRGDVIGFFVGDYHTDMVEYDNVGIPYILTGNAVMYSTPNPAYVPRYDGDKSELLFDVITVNKKKRSIFITRVGAGEDRYIQY